MEMVLPPTEIRYEKTSGFATTKGQMYEAKLSALLFLRGVNSGLDFQLASNVKGAGALDDLVYRVRSQSNSDAWTSFFVQLKHLENSRLCRRMLTDSKGKFSLPKYLESYEDIKQAMTAPERSVLFDGDFSDSNFVIFTNACAHEDLGAECRGSQQVNELLGSNSGKVFNFDPKGDSEAEEAVVGSLRDCVGDWTDFLKRLFIFAGQPSEAKLDSVIKQELEKTAAGCSDFIETDRLFACFMENVKSWWENGKCILHRGSDLFVSARNRVLVETSSLLEIKANKLDLVFEEHALSPLRAVLGGAVPVVHIVSSEKSCRVSCTKLLQALESSAYLFLGSERLLSIRGAVLALWGKEGRNTLVVSVNNRDSSRDETHFQELLELYRIAVFPKKRLVILTHSAIETSDLKHLEDTFEFSSLSSTTRNSFLAAKFALQGCSASFKAFFDSFTSVLSASLVEEVTRAGPMLSLGNGLPKHDKHYIPRGLEPPNYRVLPTIFQLPFLPQTVTVLNATPPDIAAVFLQRDSSLTADFVQQTLKDGLGSFVREPTNNSIFVGETFSLATFECNYVGTTFDKASALRIRPISDDLKRGWFVFPFQGTSESEVTKLTESHIACHFLKMSDGDLYVIKTWDAMSVVRDHMDVLRPANVLDLEERVVIVCGEPGMGKSTLVAHLGYMTKQAHPQLWVILITLNRHTHLFAQEIHDDAVGFLLAAAGISSPLDQAMFRLALEAIGNVVVILDGFDEIAPTYVQHCCHLLSKILETKAQKVWITTRISVKSGLESHLSTTALRLCKFNDDDQRFYLKRYWLDAASASGKGALSEAELDDFIGRLFEMVTQSMRDWGNDLLGVPLQAQIMAEVFVEDVTNRCSPRTLPEKLDWLQLLDMFIEKKLALYVQEKLKIKSSDTNYEMLLNSSRSVYVTNHMEAAFHLIFNEDYVKEMQTKDLIGDFSDFLKKIESGEEKTGFIDSVTNGRARFVHRVFAEYFVAKWFAANLPEFAKFIEKRSMDFYGGAYLVPRLLCDLILAKGLELHSAVLNGYVDKVKSLLAEGADVNARDRAGRTPLHLTAAFGRMEQTEARHVEILDILVQNPLTDFNVKDELLQGTPLRYADVSEYWVMIDRLLSHNVGTECLTITLQRLGLMNRKNCILFNDLDKLLEFIVSKEPKYCNENERHGSITSSNMPVVLDGNGLLANASQNGCVRIVRMLINRGYDINGLTRSRNSTEYPPLHCASNSGHLEIVQLLVNASRSRHTEGLLPVTAESHFEDTHLLSSQGSFFTENLFYLEPDFVNRKVQGRTALQLACEHGHREIVSFLIAHGADVTSCDNKERTCLHLTARSNRPDILRILLGAVKDRDRPALVNSTDYITNTALHLAASTGSVDSVTVLVGAGAKMTADEYRQTPLMLAARRGHLDVVQYLVAALDGDSDGNGFRNSLSRSDWIDLKDAGEWTALNLAAKLGFGNVASFLADSGADTRDRVGPCTGMPKDYLAEEMEFNYWRTEYEGFVYRYRDRTDRLVWGGTGIDWDGAGNTLLHIAARKGYLGVCDVIVKFGAEVTRLNNAGQTPLMLAAGSGFYYVVGYLLEAIESSSVPMAKADYVDMKDCQGKTAAFYSARSGHICTTNLLARHGADVDFLAVETWRDSNFILDSDA